MTNNKSKTDLVWGNVNPMKGVIMAKCGHTGDEILYADYGKETSNMEIYHIGLKFSSGSEYPKFINMSKYTDKAICTSVWEYK